MVIGHHPWKLDGDADDADSGCGVGSGGWCLVESVGGAVVAFAVALVEACGHRHLSAVKLPVLSQWLLP